MVSSKVIICFICASFCFKRIVFYHECFLYWYVGTMAQNNNFPESLITNLKVQIKQQKVHQTQDKDDNQKRATFSYYSPKIGKLTNLFKHTNINIAFKNTNTIQQYTKPKVLDKNQDYIMSGIYKLTCNTCKMSYIGQTSSNLNQR